MDRLYVGSYYYTSAEIKNAKFTYQSYYLLYALLVLHSMDSCAKRVSLKLSMDRPHVRSYYTDTETNGAKFSENTKISLFLVFSGVKEKP